MEELNDLGKKSVLDKEFLLNSTLRSIKSHTKLLKDNKKILPKKGCVQRNV